MLIICVDLSFLVIVWLNTVWYCWNPVDFCHNPVITRLRVRLHWSDGNVKANFFYNCKGPFTPSKSEIFPWCLSLIPLSVLNYYFFKKVLEDMSPFCEATDTPVLDFWWHLPWVPNPGWIPHLHASSPVHNRCLRFTSGVTPADLLAACMAANHVPYMHVAEVGCQDTIRRPPAQ